MNHNLELLEKIESCEDSYISCFSEHYEDDSIIRYRDKQLDDMYSHNYTYIKKDVPQEVLQQLIQEESEYSQGENKNYLKLTMDDLPEVDGLEWPFGKIETSHNGQYIYASMESPKWKTQNGYEIRRITEPSMVEDLLEMDLIHDGEVCGEDFCKRRAWRKGEVYLSEKPIDCYICYFDGTPVGNCDLFLHNGIAKIEDFEVLPAYQRKGIGTTLLKHLIDTALSKGAKIIYLTADEDDTPKEMYIKLGFEKVTDSYELFGKL